MSSHVGHVCGCGLNDLGMVLCLYFVYICLNRMCVFVCFKNTQDIGNFITRAPTPVLGFQGDGVLSRPICLILPNNKPIASPSSICR